MSIQMEKLLKDIEEVVDRAYLEIKDSPNIEFEILKIHRVLRWTEPELAGYVKKRLSHLAKRRGNS